MKSGVVLTNLFWTAALALAVSGALAAGLLLSGADVATLMRESGPIENTQALTLLLGSLIFAALALRAATRPYRILFAALAVFYLTFVMREIEVEVFLADYPLLAVLDSPLRNYWVSALWAVVIVVALRHLKPVLQAFAQWVRHLPGYMILVAGVFYGAAEGVEKRVFGFVPERLRAYEELPEVVAAILMLVCAALSTRWAGRAPERWFARSDEPAQQADPGERRDRESDERRLDGRVQ